MNDAPQTSTALTLTPAHRAARQQCVNASEVAALFGLHPRITALQLALDRLGDVPLPDPSGEEFVQRGVFFEDGVARWVMHRTRWRLMKHGGHVIHPNCAEWGASPDYVRWEEPAETSQTWMGPVEIKVVTPFAREGWVIGDDEQGLEAPLHIELQLQAQMGAMQKDWGAIGADLAGKLKIIEREIDPRAQEAIGEAIVNFWEMLRKGDLPQPTERDAETIKRLYSKATPGKVVEAADDTYRLILDLEAARAAAKEAKAACEQAEAKVLQEIKDAECVKLGDGRMLNAKVQKRAEHMVKASEFRVLRFVKDAR
jgi:predicted phage-related endonuclease